MLRFFAFQAYFKVKLMILIISVNSRYKWIKEYFIPRLPL
jgi:hypothetical protein